MTEGPRLSRPSSTEYASKCFISQMAFRLSPNRYLPCASAPCPPSTIQAPYCPSRYASSPGELSLPGGITPGQPGGPAVGSFHSIPCQCNGKWVGIRMES